MYAILLHMYNNLCMQRREENVCTPRLNATKMLHVQFTLTIQCVHFHFHARKEKKSVATSILTGLF